MTFTGDGAFASSVKSRLGIVNETRMPAESAGDLGALAVDIATHSNARFWNEISILKFGISESGVTGGYEEPANIVWQTRTHAPSPFETALADALEAIFAQEIYELGAVVAELNRRGLRTEDGAAWTAEAYAATLKRLGA